jgi:hypothetical protein
VFPKVLPKQCFPDKPDDAMETWYEGVAARLKREAEEEATRARLAAAPGPRVAPETARDGGSSADERTGAFKYFEDPMYRKARPRPGFMRHVSKQQAIYPMDDRGGKAVTSRVRHMVNPFNGRNKGMPGRYESDSYSDEDATPLAANPPPMPRYANHKRPHPPRREGSLPTTDSDDDDGRPPSRRRTPDLRHRRPHEPDVSRDYFPTHAEAHRHSSGQHYPNSRPTSNASSPQPVYRPSASPLFATQVAQMEARNYYDARPTMPPRASYRPIPQNGRWGTASVPVSPPRETGPYHARDHHRDHPRAYDRDRDRDASYHAGGSSSSHGHHRRRSTEDASYPREREGDAAVRTRSHDRRKDEWDDRDGGHERKKKVDWDDSEDYERSRDHSKDRERDRRTHRYVPGGVQDGVSGRRYPVVSNPY